MILLRKTLLMLALVLSFALHAPIPCLSAPATPHCPMHSATESCCRIAGCFSSASARHDVASLEAPASVPMPLIAVSYYVRDSHFDGFVRAIALGASPPQQLPHSLEFRPLLI